jgi:hypothetical protein
LEEKAKHLDEINLHDLAQGTRRYAVESEKTANEARSLLGLPFWDYTDA